MQKKLKNTKAHSDILAASWILSLLIHILIVAAVFFGLPNFKTTKVEQQVITVDLVPIKNKSNIKTQEQQQKTITKKKTTPPKIKKKAAPKPAPKPQRKPEIIKPKPKPVAKAQTKPVPQKKVNPVPQKKPTPTPKPTPKPQENNLDQLLKNIDLDDKKKTDENKNKAQGKFDHKTPLSLSETDALNNYFLNCWNPLVGIKDADKLSVPLLIHYNKDRTVQSIKILEQSKYNSDHNYKIATDRAIQAVKKCSPVPEEIFSINKYSTWQEIEYDFDPSALLE